MICRCGKAVAVAGRCRTCYSKDRLKLRGPSRCHPDRKEHSRGFCRSCYRKEVTRNKASCHPDKPHVAHGLCQGCYNDKAENKRREALRQRRKKYGVTPKWIAQKLEEQVGSCAICGKGIESDFALDHDHKTGSARGLLCRSCNVGLGHFGDSPERLLAAVEYLRRHA